MRRKGSGLYLLPITARDVLYRIAYYGFGGVIFVSFASVSCIFYIISLYEADNIQDICSPIYNTKIHVVTPSTRNGVLFLQKNKKLSFHRCKNRVLLRKYMRG